MPNGAQSLDDGPFEVCDECGRVLVNADTHTCPLDDPRSEATQSREERRELAERDSRAGDTTVLVFRRAGRHSYAYHDINDAGVPVCGAHKRSNATRRERVTIREAKSRGKAPCGSCKRFRD